MGRRPLRKLIHGHWCPPKDLLLSFREPGQRGDGVLGCCFHRLEGDASCGGERGDVAQHWFAPVIEQLQVLAAVRSALLCVRDEVGKRPCGQGTAIHRSWAVPPGESSPVIAAA